MRVDKNALVRERKDPEAEDDPLLLLGSLSRSTSAVCVASLGPEAEERGGLASSSSSFTSVFCLSVCSFASGMMSQPSPSGLRQTVFWLEGL